MKSASAKIVRLEYSWAIVSDSITELSFALDHGKGRPNAGWIFDFLCVTLVFSVPCGGIL